MPIPLFFCTLKKCNNCSFWWEKSMWAYSYGWCIGKKNGDKTYPLGSFFRGCVCSKKSSITLLPRCKSNPANSSRPETSSWLCMRRSVCRATASINCSRLWQVGMRKHALWIFPLLLSGQDWLSRSFSKAWKSTLGKKNCLLRPISNCS